MTTMQLTDLQKLTKPYADVRGQLAEIVTEVKREQDAILRKKLPVIRELVARAAERESNLRAAIEGNSQLFIKPRTVVFHGIKIGLQEGKDGIEFDEADKVLTLIREHYGDDAVGLIHVIESPDKKMLRDLPDEELKKLGCQRVNPGDEVVIRPTDTNVDKIVTPLLKDATDTQKAA
jgi:hypothetical protein